MSADRRVRSVSAEFAQGLGWLAAAPAIVALAAGVAFAAIGMTAEAPARLALALVGVLSVLAALVVFLRSRGLGHRFGAPLDRLEAALDAVAGGNTAARIGALDTGASGARASAAGASADGASADGASAAGAPGRVARKLDALLDRLLDDRVASLEQTIRDNEDLNNSVVEIMHALGTIASTKDLGIRVQVTDNVTGAIAEALNLLTEETGRVLSKVADVAHEVARTTGSVRGQSDLATRAVAREQREVTLAARELGTAAQALVSVAERARQADEVAGRAVRTTAAAVETVAGTVDGIVRSRELIRETEKRVKRLGERSQEIGQVVGIIQGIAERTGILALNASMHAAAAGEAGRNFATVADEVKRLSESARDSTARIGRLVHAIQTETHETVRAMNQAITRVVEISHLADEAGGRMRLTQQETEALAANVREIASTSDEQARVSAGLRERAVVIQEASAETARQLTAQNIETRRLVECARLLVAEVSVFRMPPAP